jgi:hypothetical protein
MVESDIILLYVWSCIWGIISAMGPSVALYRPHGGLFPVMAAEGPRHSHRRRVGGIVYAHGAPGHTDCCGTRKSDSSVRAS